MRRNNTSFGHKKDHTAFTHYITGFIDYVREGCVIILLWSDPSSRSEGDSR
jgi:hypothetical protein